MRMMTLLALASPLLTTTACAPLKPMEISSAAATVIQSKILGLGFNTKTHEFWSDAQWQQIQTALQQTRPGYMRLAFNLGMFSQTPGDRRWMSEQHQRLYRYLRDLKRLNTNVHLYLHHERNPAYIGGGSGRMSDAQIQAYATLYADVLEHLVKVEKFDNIIGWAPSNEMSTQEAWGFYYFGDETTPAPQAQAAYFKLTNAVQRALIARKLGHISLRLGEMRFDGPLANANMALNANPLLANGTISMHFYPSEEGETSNMTGALIAPKLSPETYATPEATLAFGRFLQHFRSYIPPERSLVVGEFGGLVVDDWNVRRSYYKDGNSGRFGLYIAERAVQFLAGGYRGLAKWTLEDLDFQNPNTLLYQHGSLALTDAKNFRPRPDYYSYGLLSRYLPRDASTHPLTSPDALVHGIGAAFSQNQRPQTTIVVVNRLSKTQPVNLTFSYPALQAQPKVMMCRMTYESTQAPSKLGLNLPEGQLISFEQTLGKDKLKPDSLTVYTTAYTSVQGQRCF